MNNRKFFVCSAGKPGEGYLEENFDRIVKRSGFVLHESTTRKGPYKDIKTKDVLLLKYNRKFVAYGEVTKTEITNDVEWNHWAFVAEWIFSNPENPRDGIGKYGIGTNTLDGGPYDTVKELDSKYALGKIEEIDKDSELFRILKLEIGIGNEGMQISNITKILKFKKQMILYGAPGTGKTRLAQIIAEEMTKANKIGNPITLINEFFKNPVVDISKQQKRDQLRKSFLEKFPKEKLKDLTLEEYSIGTGDNDSFCWWLERGLEPLGYYSPGSARSYLIYWKNEISDYSKHGKIKEIPDNQEAMQILAKIIYRTVNENDYSIADEYFGRSFLLKLLNSYYPEEYFPINSEKCIDNALKLLSFDFTGMNALEKNKKLNELFRNKSKEFSANITNNDFTDFLFDNFNLKTGEFLTDNNEIEVEGEFKLIQFHPAYTYEDFVRGITPKTSEEMTVLYPVENKILAEYAQKAQDNPKGNYVLIIDEINRANLPSVLGELIYALEYRTKPVTSLYEYKGDREIIIPNNLYIIGTMNTADRSIGHIDYAIRRRFAFYPLLSNKQNIQEYYNLKKVDTAIMDKALILFDKIFNIIEQNISSDFSKEDLMIGHSYFMAETEDNLRLKLDFEIKPLLKEYVKDGILNNPDEVLSKIEVLSL
jgi:5-methylcytosine-specific restriction enzyme B